MTTIEQLHRKWLKDKKYRRDYETLQTEYSLSATLLSARVAAGLTQEQLAKRMKTTQSVIARLETGRAMPSTRTLQKLARATGTELRIVFEPSQSRGAQVSVHTGR
jgi:ribosome-binding protein aMBF1 (putative translation factor)